MHHCLYGYILKKIVDVKAQRQPFVFFCTILLSHQGRVHLDSFHKDLINVGILFLLSRMVTIFILFQVAEYQTKEVLGGPNYKRQRMKREGRQFHGLFLF